MCHIYELAFSNFRDVDSVLSDEVRERWLLTSKARSTAVMVASSRALIYVIPYSEPPV